MSEILQIINNPEKEGKELPIYVSSGLEWGIRFAELLIPKLQGTAVRVAISGWGVEGATGLFFDDRIHGKAIRVGPNVATGCGRVFWGKSDDFEYPSRRPTDRIVESNLADFDEDDLPEIVESAVVFFCNPDA